MRELGSGGLGAHRIIEIHGEGREREGGPGGGGDKI